MLKEEEEEEEKWRARKQEIEKKENKAKAVSCSDQGDSSQVTVGHFILVYEKFKEKKKVLF